MIMTFQQALQLYGLSSLEGQTERSIKKIERKLIKTNHPDSKIQTDIKMDSILDGYKILITNLNGQVAHTLEPLFYTGYYKTKEKKILNHMEFINALDIENRKIEDLNIDYLLYLSCKFVYRHIRDKEILGELKKVYEFKYKRNDTYVIDVSLDFNLGDKLEINFENGVKVMSLELNSLNNMALLSLEPTCIDSLKFMISVRND